MCCQVDSSVATARFGDHIEVQRLLQTTLSFAGCAPSPSHALLYVLPCCCVRCPAAVCAALLLCVLPCCAPSG
jgi:hypothetical protein